MKIRDVMTPNPRTVSPDDTVQAAARIMQAEDTGAVPVVNNGRVLAMVTDRDIVVRVVAEGGSLTGSIRDIASMEVICASPEMSTREASELMSEHQVRRLPESRTAFLSVSCRLATSPSKKTKTAERGTRWKESLRA